MITRYPSAPGTRKPADLLKASSVLYKLCTRRINCIMVWICIWQPSSSSWGERCSLFRHTIQVTHFFWKLCAFQAISSFILFAFGLIFLNCWGRPTYWGGCWSRHPTSTGTGRGAFSRGGPQDMDWSQQFPQGVSFVGGPPGVGWRRSDVGWESVTTLRSQECLTRGPAGLHWMDNCDSMAGCLESWALYGICRYL